MTLTSGILKKLDKLITISLLGNRSAGTVLFPRDDVDFGRECGKGFAPAGVEFVEQARIFQENEQLPAANAKTPDLFNREI